MTYIEEQEQVIYDRAETLVVEAGAGSGKTTTLDGYARARARRPMLYLAYNKPIKEEAERRFPSNVTSKTTHGLAWAPVGRRYTREKGKVGNIKPYMIAEQAGCDMVTAGYVTEALKHWMTTADPEVLPEHLLYVSTVITNPLIIGRMVGIAHDAWKIMQDEKDPRIVMPHDGYLKLFQIGNYPLPEYKTWLVDEAQDLTPVTLKIIQDQPNIKRVLVGDPYQAIYAYRGARDALSQVDGARRYLRHSFRFGDGIAQLATRLLQRYGGATHALIGREDKESRFDIDTRKPYTVIARSNGRLFKLAVDLMERGQTFSYVGGLDKPRFSLILDVHALYARRHDQIVDPFIRSFKTFSDMSAYAEQLEDKELKSLALLADCYQSDLPDLVRRIQARAAMPSEAAQVLLTTAHKSKGLEWDQVALLDDFLDLSEWPEDEAVPMEEICLLHVAVTRARTAIRLPQNLAHLMEDTALHAPRPGPGSLILPILNTMRSS